MKAYKIFLIVLFFIFFFEYVFAESKFNDVWIRGWLNTSGNIFLGTDDILFVDNTSGRVGIGTAGPVRKLHVESTDTYITQFGDSNSELISIVQLADWGGIGMRSTGDDFAIFVDDSASRAITLKATTGNVGIGTTSPNATLTVKVGGTTIADEWTVRSDKTKKKDISEFNSDNLLSLPFSKAYTYKMQWEEPIYNVTNRTEIIGKKTVTGDKTHLGLVYDEAPEILRGNNNGIDLYAFNTYNYMLIKELKQEIQAIETFLSDYEFNITSFPSVVKYRCASRDLEKECYQLSGGKNTRCYMTKELQYGVYFICYEGWIL